MGRIPRSVLVITAAGAFAGGAAPAFGAIALREPVAYTVGAGTTGVAVADVDGDGNQDAVVSAGAVWVLRGDGAGRLGPAAGYGGGTAGQPVAADVNLDGRPDLVAAQPGPPGGVTVLLADGAGGFRQGPVLAAGVGASAVAVGDLNGDRLPDIVAAITGGATAPGTLSVFLGDGAGGFAAPGIPPTTFPGGRYVALADVDRDGHLDALVAGGLGFVGARAVVLPGDGSGGFGAARDVPATGQTSGIATGDLNRDGLLDAVTVNWDLPLLATVALGDGAGGFVGRLGAPVPGRGGARTPAVADFDGDGAPDVAAGIGNAGFGDVSILFGDGAGGLANAATCHLDGISVNAIAAGDLNGDGLDDVVAVGAEGGAVVLLGAPAGSTGTCGEQPATCTALPTANAAGAPACEAVPVATGVPLALRTLGAPRVEGRRSLVVRFAANARFGASAPATARLVLMRGGRAIAVRLRRVTGRSFGVRMHAALRPGGYRLVVRISAPGAASAVVRLDVRVR